MLTNLLRRTRLAARLRGAWRHQAEEATEPLRKEIRRLARPGDSEVHGTQLFRIINDREAPYKQTYYPEADGRRCELATVVPFRRNTMLVFLNSRGAHGATIPPDSAGDLERDAYQFYVAPENEALGKLIRELPRERRTMWQDKNRFESTSA